ncbi:hypothetical protein B0J12DRAFT_332675 [Macrophomina phaseolina]|uniref:Uncharacterized protein n=1 Tax=Macrophomina phaseolina TaxID=35725 RepID=A0ABQ8GPA8_9PEZI|nr:hypothetical protein B0J12DRAFT_332675 [Macrophomina phaseolina]
MTESLFRIRWAQLRLIDPLNHFLVVFDFLCSLYLRLASNTYQPCCGQILGSVHRRQLLLLSRLATTVPINLHNTVNYSDMRGSMAEEQWFAFICFCALRVPLLIVLWGCELALRFDSKKSRTLPSRVIIFFFFKKKGKTRTQFKVYGQSLDRLNRVVSRYSVLLHANTSGCHRFRKTHYFRRTRSPYLRLRHAALKLFSRSTDAFNCSFLAHKLMYAPCICHTALEFLSQKLKHDYTHGPSTQLAQPCRLADVRRSQRQRSEYLISLYVRWQVASVNTHDHVFQNLPCSCGCSDNCSVAISATTVLSQSSAH